MSIKVLVLADVRLYREGLSRLVRDHPELCVVGTGPIDHETVEQAASRKPDVILVEASVACGTGIVSEFAALAPSAQIVAYGVDDEAEQAVRCAEVGVAAYVPGDAAGEVLVQTIIDLARGEFRCSPRVSALLMSRVGALSRGRVPRKLDRLTPRESAILELIADGLSNKQIAVRLGIRVCTVKNHVHNILDKLQVTRRTQAAAHHRTVWPFSAAERSNGRSGSLYPPHRRNAHVSEAAHHHGM